MATLWIKPRTPSESASDSMPRTVGVWLVAQTPSITLTPIVETGLDADGYPWSIEMTITERPAYPCKCAPPCKTRGEKTCFCHGRTDIGDHLPPHCCARFEVANSSWRIPDEDVEPPVPLSVQWVAPLVLDGSVKWVAPRYIGPYIPPRPQWVAPIDPDTTDWQPPIRILERWERHSKYPQPGEIDCHICGELLSPTISGQGYVRHVLC